MSVSEPGGDTPSARPAACSIDMKLEVVGVPVSDVERAKRFYENLGWRLDADIHRDGGRLLQFTPPGSSCSIHVGNTKVLKPPGSSKGLYLVVPNLAAARSDLLARGVAASEIFHRGSNDEHLTGRDPQSASYASLCFFADPDGNGWLLQEVTVRLPGRIDSGTSSFASVAELAAALRRAASAHGAHEKAMGHADANWADWYAGYLAREQSGQPPTS